MPVASCLSGAGSSISQNARSRLPWLARMMVPSRGVIPSSHFAQHASRTPGGSRAEPQQNAGSRRRTTVPRWVSQVLVLGLVVMSGSVAGCQPSGQPQRGQTATVDTVAILAALDSLAGAVTRADNTGDAELFAATWAEDGAMSAPGSP